MKKRIIIAVCAVLVVVALVFLLKPLFKSNDQTYYEISESQVASRMLINKITNAVNKDYLAKSFKDKDFEQQYAKVQKPEDRNGVVEELKEAKFVEETLISQNKVLKREDVRKTVKAEFELMKVDTSATSYYKSLDLVLKEMGISEEIYLNLNYDYAYDAYNRSAFDAWFVESEHYDKDFGKDHDHDHADEHSLDAEQIEAYIHEELAKVKVVVKH